MTLLQFETTGEGGGQGYAYWAGLASVPGTPVFTGVSLQTTTELELAGGVPGQSGNGFIGGDGADGFVHFRWPVNLDGTNNIMPSVGEVKFSDLGKLGKSTNGSVSIGNYFAGSTFLPSGWVQGGSAPARFLMDGVTVSSKSITAFRSLYLEKTFTDVQTGFQSFDLPAYVTYVAVRLVGASGGGGGGDLSLIAGAGGRGLSVDGIYDGSSLGISSNKTVSYINGGAGQGGVKSVNGPFQVGGTGLFPGGNGGQAGTTGQSGQGGSGGGSTVVQIESLNGGQLLVAGGGGGGGGAARFVANAALRDGNSIGTGGTLSTTITVGSATAGDSPTGDAGGCGGGGGFGGQGGQYSTE